MTTRILPPRLDEPDQVPGLEPLDPLLPSRGAPGKTVALGPDYLTRPPAHGLDPQGLAGAVNPHGPAAFPDTGRIDPVALGIALGAAAKLRPSPGPEGSRKAHPLDYIPVFDALEQEKRTTSA